ncbi:MAG: HAMP domain-containing histidine kinase [Anaerolineae bacterium]|nr:HAMP domain-containing histidine kinase [Anaerolineae bacterium]
MAMIRAQAFEEAQEEASLEKVRFLQRLDHELKNPLAAMQIALANLEEAQDADKRSEIRSSMRSQLLRMSYLLGDLRKLASLGKGEIERVPVTVTDLLDDLELIFRDSDAFQQRRYVSDFDLDPSLILIGDRDLLQLAFHNVIDNALKFTKSGDKIGLTAYMDDEELVIEVRDTGRGIPPHDIPHVWEDLYRSSDVHGIPGSGVGLAMVKGIIEQHDGSVDIDSTYGAGTIVTLRLPIRYGTE